MDDHNDHVAQRCPTKAFLPMSFLGIRMAPVMIAALSFLPMFLALNNLTGAILEVVAALGGGWLLTKIADNYPMPTVLQHLTRHRIPILSDAACRAAERAGLPSRLPGAMRCDP